jgi:hypothetical protein
MGYRLCLQGNQRSLEVSQKIAADEPELEEDDDRVPHGWRTTDER